MVRHTKRINIRSYSMYPASFLTRVHIPLLHYMLQQFSQAELTFVSKQTKLFVTITSFFITFFFSSRNALAPPYLSPSKYSFLKAMIPWGIHQFYRCAPTVLCYTFLRVSVILHIKLQEQGSGPLHSLLDSQYPVQILAYNRHSENVCESINQQISDYEDTAQGMKRIRNVFLLKTQQESDLS